MDCLHISTTPVKAVIDDQIQRLFDALLNSLRRAINNDVTTIDTFLTQSMETLSQRPQTVEEIGEANAKHAEFSKTKAEVIKHLLSSTFNRMYPHSIVVTMLLLQVCVEYRCMYVCIV